MHTALRIALLVAPLIAPALDLTAQEPPATSEPRAAQGLPAAPEPRVAKGKWLAGGSLGVPGFASEPFPAMFTIGGNWTQLNTGRPGADFSAGILPYGLIRGFLAFGARGGVALPVAVSSRMLLVPSGGLSVIGAVGRPGGVGLTGYNAGMAAVLFPGDGPGIRAGITWHRFGEERAALWLMEIGYVRNPLRPGQGVAP